MKFSFYRIDPTYCDFLREKDSRVPYTMDKKPGDLSARCCQFALDETLCREYGHLCKKK